MDLPCKYFQHQHTYYMLHACPRQAPIYERGVCQWARAVSQAIKSHPTLSPFLPWLSYFPSEWSLLRMICCYINKGRNWSGLFVRERAQLSFELLGGDLIHYFIKLMYLCNVYTQDGCHVEKHHRPIWWRKCNCSMVYTQAPSGMIPTIFRNDTHHLLYIATSNTIIFLPLTLVSHIQTWHSAPRGRKVWEPILVQWRFEYFKGMLI